jgi:Ca2+-binding EF-hand superfamily protein
MGGMRMGADRDGKRPGMMRMGGHMMKLMFAIADTDGDGALSFDEVTAVHRRIFNAIDANKDGRVTLDEFRAFMRD